MTPIDQLKAVLCDPSGKCCITGSDEDRAIVDRALQALAQPEQEPVATMKMLHTYGDTTPPERPWIGLTEANMKVLIEQARVVPKQSPCPDYNARLLMLTNAVLKELNT